jgi:thiamine-phosphate pyrophosphorylase
MKRLQQALRVLSEYGGLDDTLRYSAYDIEIKMYMKMDLKKHLLKDKNLYLVTNSDNFSDVTSFLDALGAALEGGVDIVQLREKQMSAKDFTALSHKVRELTAHYGALFIVNDRIDIAHITGADGVHLGQEDMSVQAAREILPKNAIVGVSTHKPEDALLAMDDGADYIGVGPVFKTPTKPLKTPVGLEYVAWAAKNVNIPFFTIGAIDLENVDDVLNAGASRVAVIRALIYAQNPKEAAQKFKEKLSR